jgi:predicted transcriptional regulator
MTEQPQSAPQPIKVKMKVGNVEFDLEGTVDQVNEAVGKLLATVSEKLKETSLLMEKETAPSRETCKALIQRLWEEGWFASGRGLGEVHSEMARRGFHYDRTAVAHALIDLVKDGVLNREGHPRRYQYVQKRPPMSPRH